MPGFTERGLSRGSAAGPERAGGRCFYMMVGLMGVTMESEPVMAVIRLFLSRLLAVAAVLVVPVVATGVDDVPVAGGGGGAAGLPSGANVAVLPVRGLIYGYTLSSIEQRAQQAIREGASVIVLELDTPGGLVDSALKISKYIKGLPVRTVAWINPEAYSAGIMIAAACNEIVMAPVSATGDCAPIVPGMNLSPTERAKALSPILEEFRDSARAQGYDYALFHAMCVLGVEVYQVEHTATGRRRLVNQADYGVMVGGDSLWVSSKRVGGGESSADGEAVQALPADQATLVGAARVNVATEADRGQWKLVRKIHDGTTLLTLNQQRAMDAGLAKALVGNEVELEQYLGAASVTAVLPTRTALVAYWLTQPWVRALLMVTLVMGVYLEMQAPGLGVAGFVAVVSLTLLVVAPFLVGLAQMWHVLLFAGGVVLVLLEIFVTPGFGVLGVGGIVCMFTGLVLMVVPSVGQGPLPLPAPEMAQRLQDSVLSTLVGIIGSVIGMYYLTKHFGSLPVLNRLILKSAPLAGAGGGGAITHVSGDGAIGQGRVQVGDKGEAITELRPSGRARVNERVIDVVTQGEWIEPKHAVRVVEVQGNRIVVEAEGA